jgi:hypothetical protein
MTKFDELQQAHQQLLDRMDEAADKVAFAREVQAYVARVCDEAVDVPAPRDRDQLRANLRFWASYVYDATGTYPNTTMRPPQLERVSYAPSAPPVPQPKAKVSARRSIMIGLGILAVLGLIVISPILLLSRPVESPAMSDPTATRAPAATRAPTRLPAKPTEQPGSSGAVSVAWTIVTQGPSPFDPNVWAARVKLSATGGNGKYIYWVDGQRLPDASNGEFTIEGQGCQAKRAEVGVTSDGQAASQSLAIKSPLSQCR